MSDDEPTAAPGGLLVDASTERGEEVLRLVASRVAASAAAEEATRLDVLRRNAYWIGRLVGGGHMTHEDARNELVGALAGWQLSNRDQRRLKRKIELALRAGKRRPLNDPSPVKREAATTEGNSAVGP